MTRILDRIEYPDDLKGLSNAELQQLADEIREYLIDSLAQSGGHFGSNLGTVELTIALHKAFDAPRDRLVWDVGHQAYVHKILTGRKDRLPTIRQFGGLCPFLRRDESEYDTFGAGHAGTAISAAYGMAVARDMKGDDYKVVSIIGDATLTIGMAFEALNCAGAEDRDFLVVLNDNGMSIAKNVGVFSTYLNKIITNPHYNRLKSDVEEILERIPAFGKGAYDMSRRVQEGLKNLVTPGMIFEELDFRYFGPVDGHDIDALMNVFERVRDNVHEPALVHVMTEKGKGYPEAEQSPEKLHAVKKDFNKPSSGPVKTKAPSYTSVFADALIELSNQDKDIVGITAAMPSGTGLDKYKEAHPDRYFDVGIAEQHAVTFAAGLACDGLKPVVAIYSTFLQRGFDQVLHDVCIQKLNVNFAMDRGGLAGNDGETHQGMFDLSYLRLIPDIILMAPKDENELRNMLKTCVDYEGPAAFRYPRGSALGVPIDDEIRALPIGKAEVIREGTDVALFAVGNLVQTAEEAAQELENQGISAAVINGRFIKPVDEEEILRQVEKTHCIVTLEENTIVGGFGSAVAEALADRGVKDSTLLRIALPDQFIEHGDQPVLRDKYGLSTAKVVPKIAEFVAKSKQAMGNGKAGAAEAEKSYASSGR